MRPLIAPLDVSLARRSSRKDDLPRVDALVAKRIEELSLPTFLVSSPDAFVTVHEDEAGVARAAFVMNPTAAALTVSVSIRGAQKLTDLAVESAKTQKTINVVQGSFSVVLPARTVRFFAID